MFGTIKQFLNLCLALATDPSERERMVQPRRFWFSNKKRSAVSVIVPDASGEKLVLLLQRPIERGDVKDGKLLPSAKSVVKRRGGKRQTSLALSFESAEMLHKALGEALEDAKSKQRQKELLDFAVLYSVMKGTAAAK